MKGRSKPKENNAVSTAAAHYDMTKPGVFFGAIGLGMLLLILSGIWTTLFPGTSSWTQEKSELWMKTKDRLHNLGFVVANPTGHVSMHSGPETGQAKQEYDRLIVESDRFAVEFQSAYDRPRTISAILKWTGISLAVLGIIGLYVVNQSR